MKTKFLLTTIFSLLLVIESGAQTSISLSQNLSYYSNSFYNYKQLPDVNNYIGLNISHIFETETIQSQLYYEGDLNFFKNYSERRYHNQSIGYNGYFDFKNNRSLVYFGGSLYWHDGRESYDSYDFNDIELYTNAKFDLRQNIIGRIGYIFNNRNYSELSEFSYREHYFFARVNTFFQSGTSLTFDFNYGLKDYIPRADYQDRSRGRFMSVEYSEMPSVDQLVSSVKIAQSLGSKTSLSVKYLTRSKPGPVSGQVSVINNEELFTEDELFDDRYGYGGHEIYSTFTHFLPLYIKFEIGVSQLWKNYYNRQVYDLDGIVAVANINRQDQRRVFWGELGRSFGINRGLKTIRISITGGYIDNVSNDSYYQFDNVFCSLKLRFNIR